MKKLFTLTLPLFAAVFSFAQAPLNVQPNETNEISHHALLNSKSANRQFVSEWYNYGETIDGMGGNCDYYRNYLFPDSTVLTEFSSGFGSVWKHSYGQMCDPSSLNFINNTLIDQNADYTVDSVLLWYRYYRFQHNNPDTVVFQFYEDPDITFVADPWSDDRSYANVPYNPGTRKGSGFSSEVVVLLGENDTATATQHGILVPVGVSVPAGKKFGATVTYFPGNSYSPGDTIDPVTTATVVNKINAFTIYDYKDLDKISNQYFYNNGMLIPSDVRYNYNSNGWDSSYIAGNAYNSGWYHLDMAFKLTSNSVSVNETNDNYFSVNVFPSVVSEDNPAVVQVMSNINALATLSIFDISGKLVHEQVAQLSAGTNKLDLNSEALTSGVYFISVSINGAKETVKLVKI